MHHFHYYLCRKLKGGGMEIKMNNEIKKETEDASKELELSIEEIEGYGTCSNRTQLCLTDCPWPFDGAYLSGID